MRRHRQQTALCIGLLVLGWSVSATAGEVKLTDAAGIKKEITSRRGKVVIVNFWATWCPPCVKEFPDFVKFYKTYKSKGVEVLAVSLDDPDDLKTRVSKFVRDKRAEFPVFLAKDADDERFTASFAKEWKGEIPVTIVFDKKGKRRRFHIGMLTYAELEKMVKPLM